MKCVWNWYRRVLSVVRLELTLCGWLDIKIQVLTCWLSKLTNVWFNDLRFTQQSPSRLTGRRNLNSVGERSIFPPRGTICLELTAVHFQKFVPEMASMPMGIFLVLLFFLECKCCWSYVPCIYSHARCSYRRRFRSRLLCPLSLSSAVNSLCWFYAVSVHVPPSVPPVCPSFP